MKHRIGGLETGLGGSSMCYLDNNIAIEPCKFWDTFLYDLEKNYKIFRGYQGFDYHKEKEIFAFGIEPTYKGDELLVITINLKDKKLSTLDTGISRGFYGTDICSRSFKYSDYKLKSKFVRFVDKWWPLLREELDFNEEPAKDAFEEKVMAIAKDLEGEIAYSLYQHLDEGYTSIVIDYKKIARNLLNKGYDKIKGDLK